MLLVSCGPSHRLTGTCYAPVEGIEIQTVLLSIGLHSSASMLASESQHLT